MCGVKVLGLVLLFVVCLFVRSSRFVFLFSRWIQVPKAVGCEPIVAQDLEWTDFVGWCRPAAPPISLLSFVCCGLVRGGSVLLVLVVVCFLIDCSGYRRLNKFIHPIKEAANIGYIIWWQSFYNRWVYDFRIPF